jgi:hypothetical protein
MPFSEPPPHIEGQIFGMALGELLVGFDVGGGPHAKHSHEIRRE